MKKSNSTRMLNAVIATALLFGGCSSAPTDSSTLPNNSPGVENQTPQNATNIMNEMQRAFNPNWHVNQQEPSDTEMDNALSGDTGSAVTPPPANMGSIDNPIASLNISSPEQIDRDTAEKILKGLGIMNANRGFEKALTVINWSNTYKNRSSVPFDSKMKGYLFKHYQSYKQALEKWGSYSEISEKATPDLYDSWIRSAASQLTAVEESRRIPLMKSLMTQESGRTQWRNHVPIISYAGAIGTGQFMYATAEGIGINPYDPQENITGIAKYLNGLIRADGLEKGLARYNGGNNPPGSSYQYASAIMNRMSNIA